jgi:hypothetical protein
VRIPQRWFVERITVETYAGGGPWGDTYRGPVTVLGHISGGRRLQAGGDGEEITAEQKIMLPNPCRLADEDAEVDPAELLTPQSRVTSGSLSATATAVVEHRHPGSGRIVYVSGSLG